MPKNKKQFGLGMAARIILALSGLALVIKLLLHGNNVALFNTKGLIAHQQLSLMVFAMALLLLVAIPTLAVLFFTAWKYRQSNTKAKYTPDKRHGKGLDV